MWINTIFKPGRRLAAVASLVPETAVVADIGTDHAYLPLYLVSQKGAHHVIAVEKSPKNCEHARKVVLMFRQEHKVEVRCADGLSALRASDGVEIIVIAGLGGKTICRLLMAAGKSLEHYSRLVIQPMGDASLLRRWLISRGFAIIAERLAKEKGRFYEVMAVEKGSMKITDPLMLELGPALLADDVEPDPLLVPWIEHKIKRCEHILKCLENSDHQENEARRSYFSDRHKKLKGVLWHVGNR